MLLWPKLKETQTAAVVKRDTKTGAPVAKTERNPNVLRCQERHQGWCSCGQNNQTDGYILSYRVAEASLHSDLEHLMPASYCCCQIVSVEATTSNSNNHNAAHSIKIYRQFSFLPRTIKEWNELPSEVAAADTL